jgi:hypothetical protein
VDLTGLSRPTSIIGAVGNDLLIGGDSNDLLSGGAGIDLFAALDGFADRLSRGDRPWTFSPAIQNWITLCLKMMHSTLWAAIFG